MIVNKTRYQRLKDFVARTFFRNRKMNAEFGWEYTDMEHIAKTVPITKLNKLDVNSYLILFQWIMCWVYAADSIVELKPVWTPWFFWVLSCLLGAMFTILTLPTEYRWTHRDKVGKCLNELMYFNYDTAYNNREHAPNRNLNIYYWHREFDRHLHRCIGNIARNGCVTDLLFEECLTEEFTELADLLLISNTQQHTTEQLVDDAH